MSLRLKLMKHLQHHLQPELPIPQLTAFMRTETLFSRLHLFNLATQHRWLTYNVMQLHPGTVPDYHLLSSDILRETLQLLSTQKPGRWLRPLTHTQRTRGIYWYCVDSKAVGPKEVMLSVSNFHQFLWPDWKSLLSKSFKTLMCILHHKSPVFLNNLLAIGLKEGTEGGLVYLSTLSELASTVELARIRLQDRVSKCHGNSGNINTPWSSELPELGKNRYGFYLGNVHYHPRFSLPPI
ncbi:hypothetical protein EV426DRAFT_644975 [Tirmania nivea]|nr:hypothetical protein EV426DRAFT_644975 [Tirmania nivea]